MKPVLVLLVWVSGVCCAQGRYPPSGPPGPTGFSGPGPYVIINVKSGKALDLARRNSPTVVQNDRNASSTQIWDIREAGRGLVTIRNAGTGCALTPGGQGNSTPVLCNPLRNGPFQTWTLPPGRDGNSLIVSLRGKALDIPNGSTRSGEIVQTYERNGDDNQRFILQPAGGRGGGRPRD